MTATWCPTPWRRRRPTQRWPSTTTATFSRRVLLCRTVKVTTGSLLNIGQCCTPKTTEMYFQFCTTASTATAWQKTLWWCNYFKGCALCSCRERAKIVLVFFVLAQRRRLDARNGCKKRNAISNFILNETTFAPNFILRRRWRWWSVWPDLAIFKTSLEQIFLQK